MNRQFFVMKYKQDEPWISNARPSKFEEIVDPEFGAVWQKPLGPLDLDMYDEGDFWPDIMGCGGGVHGPYVSELVKRALETEGIDYGKAYPATVVGDVPPALRAQIPPTYFWLGAHVGAAIDYDKSGYRIKGRSKTTGITYLDPLVEPKQIMFVEGSWDGSDLFVASPPMVFFCTRRLIELASKYRWTNFRFVPIEHYHDEPPHPGVPY